MRISVTGKHVELDDTLRQYVEKKIKKLKQHGPKLHDIHIVLATEKYRAFAEVAMHVDGHAVVAKEETKELYQSIDGAIQKAERQLTRYRSKRLGHKMPRAGSQSDTPPEDDNGIDSSHPNVKIRTVPVASMSTQKALVAMRTLDDNCMIFSDKQIGCLRIVHRRPDGEVEVIDPLT